MTQAHSPTLPHKRNAITSVNYAQFATFLYETELFQPPCIRLNIIHLKVMLPIICALVISCTVNFSFGHIIMLTLWLMVLYILIQITYSKAMNSWHSAE